MSTQRPGKVVIGATLKMIRAGKRDELVLDELRRDDLDSLGWSGSPAHLRAVERALSRVANGEVEYLVIRAPTGEPVAKVGIDYAAHTNAGTFWQFATHPRLQGMGLGTRLLVEGERRIRRRGWRWAVLGVDDDNPRARALYERLGYAAWQRERASWQHEDDFGQLSVYETELTLLRKELCTQPQ
jgi:ribosomal protein S18 acetylase RimI-like enzyme